MSKIRLNTELRNKMFNKIKNVFETENTQEREAYFKRERMLIKNMLRHLKLQKVLLKEHIQQKMLKF
jgi:hypothetical protein